MMFFGTRFFPGAWQRTPLASKRDAPLFVPGCETVDPVMLHRDTPAHEESSDLASTCPSDYADSFPDAQGPKACDASEDGDLPRKDLLTSSWYLSDAAASTRETSAGSECGLSTPAWSEFEDDFMDCFSGSPLSDTPLKVTDDSWSGMRRQKLNPDKQVARLMKSILNKVTEENCPRLSQQLTQCIETVVHMKTLISMIVEMATVQHNLINMYAFLLAILSEHFEQHLAGECGKKSSFKRLLLLEFQKVFESVSEPPSDTDKKMMSKLRAIGCTKVIGILCTRRLLESDVFLAFLGELLSQGTPEALESLAALLTIVCPVFDTPDFAGHEMIEATFDKVKAIMSAAKCDTRSRVLLTNVLDLRAQGWKDSRWQ